MRIEKEVSYSTNMRVIIYEQLIKTIKYIKEMKEEKVGEYYE